MDSPFTPEQIAELAKPLDHKRVKHRQGGGGMSLGYITGHDAIDTANRLFNYGNWGYDLLKVELVNIPGENGEVIGGYYAATVQLKVKDCIPVTEEGVCPIQEGRNPRAKIDAHDMARKGAVTDALKRALRCYGDQFGNSLYDTDLIDGQPGTEKSTPAPNRLQPASQPTSRPVTPQAPRPVQTMPQAQNAPRTPQAQLVTPSPIQALSSGELATEQQRTAIVNMAGRKGVDDIELNDRLTQLYGVELKALSRNDAAHFIKVFQEQVR
jgi:DNA repair and recombination protein RAD52